jgi:hypothetical protein
MGNSITLRVGPPSRPLHDGSFKGDLRNGILPMAEGVAGKSGAHLREQRGDRVHFGLRYHLVLRSRRVRPPIPRHHPFARSPNRSTSRLANSVSCYYHDVPLHPTHSRSRISYMSFPTSSLLFLPLSIPRSPWTHAAISTYETSSEAGPSLTRERFLLDTVRTVGQRLLVAAKVRWKRKRKRLKGSGRKCHR